jgi:phage terminase large subunit-like protein
MSKEIELLPHQIPPPGDWQVWLIRGARGVGKTFAAADWLQKSSGRMCMVIDHFTKSDKQTLIEAIYNARKIVLSGIDSNLHKDYVMHICRVNGASYVETVAPACLQE